MNNNTSRRKKKNRDKKDFSLNNKMPKTDVVDMSTGVVDIDNTPDVATWNKEIRIKNDTARVVVDRFHEPEEIQTPPTIGMGLRDRKASKKDLIIDPANRKEVEEAIESSSTLTDEDIDLSQ